MGKQPSSATADSCESSPLVRREATTSTICGDYNQSPPSSPDTKQSGSTDGSGDPQTSSEVIYQAAYLVRDAVLGEQVDSNPSEGAYHVKQKGNRRQLQFRDRISLFCRRILLSSPVSKLPTMIGVILILLTFIEPPFWCRDSPEGCQELLTLEGLPFGISTNHTAKENRKLQYYPNTKSMLITNQQSRHIEAVCLALLMLYSFILIGLDGSNIYIYFRKGPALVNRILQLLCMLLLFVGLCTRVTHHHAYIRAVLTVSFLPGVQRELKVLWHTLPQAYNILLLLVILMCFYAWMGTILFVNTEEGRQHFSSFIESLWSLYICVTTANYPDVMMPAYNANRWSLVYFMSFMILSFFFFLNVVLAAVVNEYESAIESRRTSRRQQATVHLEKAYALLHDPQTGGIDQSTLMSLLQVLHDDVGDAMFRKNLSTPEQRKLVYAILDQDGSSVISSREFMNLGVVLQLELVCASSYQTAVEQFLPRVYHSAHFQRLQNMIRSHHFDTVIDCVLVLNAVVIAIQSYPQLSGQETTVSSELYPYQNGSIDTAWEVVEAVFTVLYVVECSLKLIVFGTRAYFEAHKNVFDFVITVLAVICSIVVYLPNEINDSRVVRMVVMARVLRLIRILTSRKGFQLIGAISVEILPQATNVLLILFFLLYFFAVIGTQLYGGMVTRDPDNPLSVLILNTDFSDNDYWGNNFNDMISAMNVLFNLLVVNNWTVCESGYEAVTRGKWVRWFFIAFHVFGVILVNNLVIAFVINNFMQHLVSFKEFQQQDASVVIDDGRAVMDISKRQVNFRASRVTGTRTNLTGNYIARYRRTGRLGSISESEILDIDQLRQLFTQAQLD